MTSGRMKALALSVTASALVIAAAIMVYRHSARQSAIACTLEWACLAPLPEETRDLKVTTEGSMFTRSFRLSFQAEPDVIETWLGQSPGISTATLDSSEPGRRKYSIPPGGGAQHAEMTIDDDAGEVAVYVYWS